MFGKSKKKKSEDEEQRKREEYLKRYHLNEMSDDDLEVIKSITYELTGSGLGRVAMALGSASPAENAQMSYLSVLVQQNWIIIRKLNQLLDRMGSGGGTAAN
jgi:hypothetical protein